MQLKAEIKHGGKYIVLIEKKLKKLLIFTKRENIYYYVTFWSQQMDVWQ